MLKTIGHITLSAFLLLSSTGVKINMHFCQDHLYDLALNTPARDCCSEGECMCHHDHSHDQAGKCDDRSIQIRNTDNFVVSGFYPDFENKNISDLFFNTGNNTEIFGTFKPTVPRLYHFKKPPPDRDVTLSRIQSFLI